jgi:coenzyme PQQ precursor peptide PqqA
MPLQAALRRILTEYPHARTEWLEGHALALRRAVFLYFSEFGEEDSMAWTTPVLVEICIGLEINGYLPADGYVPPEF